MVVDSSTRLAFAYPSTCFPVTSNPFLVISPHTARCLHTVKNARSRHHTVRWRYPKFSSIANSTRRARSPRRQERAQPTRDTTERPRGGSIPWPQAAHQNRTTREVLH